MHSAERIRLAVTTVQQIRNSPSGACAAVSTIKQIQSRRFSCTYADLLSSGAASAGARFFLEELYSDRDYRDRDAQFARIAGTLERMFPSQVSATAVALAELHALTETLDAAMAHEWNSPANAVEPVARRYVLCWRAVGHREDRRRQLAEVLAVGRDLGRLTRTRGLGTMLRMMRGPAEAAGLGALQRFLERGFDTFGAMVRKGEVDTFLRTIDSREKALMDLLFDAPLAECETELARLLGELP